MRTFVFLSTDDLIEQLMTMQRDVDDDQDYYKGIYSQSMSEINKYHTDYPYIQRTKKFGCWIVKLG